MHEKVGSEVKDIRCMENLKRSGVRHLFHSDLKRAVKLAGKACTTTRPCKFVTIRFSSRHVRRTETRLWLGSFKHVGEILEAG